MDESIYQTLYFLQNEQVSKRLTAIPLDDDIYEWINNVTGQTSELLCRRLRMCLFDISYSLAFPVHPFVETRQLLRNYLSPEHDVDNLAELMHCHGIQIQKFSFLLNATSDILNDQIQDDDELYLQCNSLSP